MYSEITYAQSPSAFITLRLRFCSIQEQTILVQLSCYDYLQRTCLLLRRCAALSLVTWTAASQLR